MTTTNDTGKGVYQRLTDPEGTRYLLHAVPSGYLGFSVYMPQGPVEALIQAFGVKVVNRLVFRGAWTLLAWRSDAYAPKRQRLHKERFATQAEAVAAFDRMADTIRRSGLR
jgi:hypothetical protein